MVQPATSVSCTMPAGFRNQSSITKNPKSMVHRTTFISCTMGFVPSGRRSAANFAKSMVQPAKTFRCTMSTFRRNLKIALEPWYKWTFSLPIPCLLDSGHSPSREFSKKAWYTEQLSSPVPCFTQFRLQTCYSAPFSRVSVSNL